MNAHYNDSDSKIDEAPGMKDIDLVELHSEIGKYVPEDKKKEWY
jgi:hypothetical protein